MSETTADRSREIDQVRWRIWLPVPLVASLFIILRNGEVLHYVVQNRETVEIL